MRSILWVRLARLKSTYKIYLLMMVLPLIFAFAFSYQNVDSSITIPVADEDKTSVSERLLKEVEQTSTYSVKRVSREKLYELVSEGQSEVGMIIPKGSFLNISSDQDIELQYVTIKDSTTINSIKSTITNILQTNIYNQQIIKNSLQAYKELDLDLTNLDYMEDRLTNTLFEKWEGTLPVELKNRQFKNETKFLYDHKLQTFFGFVLFFSMFTIIFTVGEILSDKKHGVWDRMIVSPVSKFQLYLGNILYSYFIGLAQILLLVVIGKFVMNVNMDGDFLIVVTILALYVFTVMALGMLLVAFVDSTQQLNSIVPVIAVSSAMVGGAYWPIEIVTNNILLLLSKVVPITYAMTSIKEVILYGSGWNGVLLPGSILFLMGVVMLGLGMQLIDRRS